MFGYVRLNLFHDYAFFFFVSITKEIRYIWQLQFIIMHVYILHYIRNRIFFSEDLKNYNVYFFFILQDFFVFANALEGTLVLRKPLDYETLSNFSVGIRAQVRNLTLLYIK